MYGRRFLTQKALKIALGVVLYHGEDYQISVRSTLIEFRKNQDKIIFI